VNHPFNFLNVALSTKLVRKIVFLRHLQMLNLPNIVPYSCGGCRRCFRKCNSRCMNRTCESIPAQKRLIYISACLQADTQHFNITLKDMQ